MYCVHMMLLLCVCDRHVSQKDRTSKRYRSAHSDVFVIADEDEELGEYQCIALYCHP